MKKFNEDNLETFLKTAGRISAVETVDEYITD